MIHFLAHFFTSRERHIISHQTGKPENHWHKVPAGGGIFSQYTLSPLYQRHSPQSITVRKKTQHHHPKKNSPKNHWTLQKKEVWMSFLQGSGISKPLVSRSHDSQGAFWLLVAPRDNSTDPCWCHWLQSPRKDHKESMKPIPPPWDQTSSKTCFSSCH